MNIQEEIGRLAVKFPLAAAQLCQCEVLHDDSIPIAAVSMRAGRGRLKIGRDFSALPDVLHQWVLVHEAMHLLLDHTRCFRNRPDMVSANEAADYASNDMLASAFGREATELARAVFTFPEDRGLPSNMSCLWYYEQIVKQKEEARRKAEEAQAANREADEADEEDYDDDNDESEDDSEDDSDGSSSEDGSDTESGVSDSDSGGDDDAAGDGDAELGVNASGKPASGDIDFDGSDDSSSPLASAAMVGGSALPDGAMMSAGYDKLTPAVCTSKHPSWFAAVRRFIQTSSSMDEEDWSYSTPNRRQLWRKIILPGHPKTEDDAEYCILLDVSSSMDARMLSSAVEQVSGFTATIVGADARARVMAFADGVTYDATFTGRIAAASLYADLLIGGCTEMQECFARLRDAKQSPMFCLCITDGGIMDTNKLIRPSFPMLWVLTTDSFTRFLPTWGMRVRMKG